MSRDQKIANDLQAIGHEIALSITGAGDTGGGAGQYEVFIQRDGIEYRVTIEPYWDDAADAPIGEESEPAELDEAFDILENALVKGFLVTDDGKVDLADLQALDAARELLRIYRGSHQ